jgi:hypothetical protein
LRGTVPWVRTSIGILVVVALLSGCKNVDELLHAGRSYDACVRSRSHPDEAPQLAAWLKDNARVDATLVPIDDVTRELGGDVRGYGAWTEADAAKDEKREPHIGLYDLKPHVPGGALLLQYVRAEQPGELVLHLPPLARWSSPPQLPILDEADLEPAPVSGGGGGGGDALTGLIDAVGAVGMGIGMAVGVAVAVPFGIIVGVAEGIGSFFDAIFGGGHAGPPPSPEDQWAPVQIENPPELPRADALLVAGPEHDAAQHDVDAMNAGYDAAVASERHRRVALATRKDLLGIAYPECETGDCRAVLELLPAQLAATALFRSSEAAPYTCTVVLDKPAPVVLTTPAPATTAKATTAIVDDLAAARAELASLSTSLDANAPDFVLAYSQASVRDATKDKAATHVEDLRCDIKVKRTHFDWDGSAPDVVARVSAGGGVRTRFHTAYLGANVVNAKLTVPGLALVAGEKLRLSLVSRHDRSLGGAVVTFDGTLPIVLANGAFRASCTAAAPVVDDAKSPVNKRRADAAKLVDAFAALAADVPRITTTTATTTTAQEEDAAKKLAALSKPRDKARAAIVALGGDVGFADGDVQRLTARLHDADPLSAR